MLHQNSFRVDVVPPDLDGFGVRGSMDCVFGEMASFPSTRVQHDVH